MSQYGLLINYEWCTGCQSCEIACKEEHGLPMGKWGIRVHDDGPWCKGDNQKMGKEFNWNKIPVPTDLCDLCEERVKSGKRPTCVHHCLAACMEFGEIAELAAKMGTGEKQLLFTK